MARKNDFAEATGTVKVEGPGPAEENKEIASVRSRFLEVLSWRWPDSDGHAESARSISQEQKNPLANGRKSKKGIENQDTLIFNPLLSNYVASTSQRPTTEG